MFRPLGATLVLAVALGVLLEMLLGRELPEKVPSYNGPEKSGERHTERVCVCIEGVNDR